MKKFLVSTIISTSLLLVACSNGEANNNNTTDNNEVAVTVVVEANDTKKETQVTVDSDDTVMDALEESHEVEDDNGFITAIDGISQDTSKNLYWMFEVNGEMGSKAADQLKVNNGDSIRFYQEAYQ